MRPNSLPLLGIGTSRISRQLHVYNIHQSVVAVSNSYRDDISDGYTIPDEKPTIGYSIPDEIPTTCFQLCELVDN